MKTNERILRNESCSACSTPRKKTLALRHRGGDVAQHVRARGGAGACGLYFAGTTGTPPVSSEARIVRRTSTARGARARAPGGPGWPARRLSCVTTRWTAARSCGGPGRQRAVQLVQRPRRRAAASCARSGARSSSRRRQLLERAGSGRAGRGARRESPSAPSSWPGSALQARARGGCAARRRRAPRSPGPRAPKAAIASRARSRSALLVAVLAIACGICSRSAS